MKLSLTPFESITVREHDPERLVVDVVYAPGGAKPPAHFHPEQDERFEVTSGAIGVKLGGDEHVLAPGDVLEIPRGTPHGLWNAGGEPARAVWTTAPAGRTLEWFQALDALQGASGTMPGPLTLAPYLRAYPDVMRLAGPQVIVRAALAVLAALSRTRPVPAP